jgi:hypothetical protein
VLDIGIPATPAEYVRTSQLVLGWEEAAVRRFLMVVGIADILVAALIWWRPTQIPALALAACWGTSTILARIIAYGHWDLSVAYREPWTYETLVRLPHVLVPLATCLLAWHMRREPGSDHKPVLMPRATSPGAANSI